jgi:hypothetical protein
MADGRFPTPSLVGYVAFLITSKVLVL